MNPAKKIISDNSGRSVLAIVLLGIVIAAALTVWIIILSGYLGLATVPDEEIDEDGGEITDIEEPGDTDDEPTDSGDDDQSNTEGNIPSTPIIINPNYPSAPVEITEISIQEAYPDMSTELDAIAERFGCAAVSLVAYDWHTDEYFTYQFGYADAAARREIYPDTKFYIASLSKLVTVICTMALVDGDYIDLDADVSRYFGYEVRNPNFPDTEITARMLMQHTSSIFDSGAYQVSRDRGSSESVRELMERGTSFRRNNPGSSYEYSNFGYAVLGSLCERVAGKSLDALAYEVLFRPLDIDAAFVPSKMRDTQNIAVLYDNNHEVSRSVYSQLAVTESDTPGHDLHLAHGNLTISAVDYAKILSMLGNGGYLGETIILSAGSANEIHIADVEGAGFMQGLATRYSESGFTGDEGFYWHTGSSYGMYSQYIHSTEHNRGVVVITTGASVSRLDNGTIDVCTELARTAWNVYGIG